MFQIAVLYGEQVFHINRDPMSIFFVLSLACIIGASLSEPHTRESGLSSFPVYIYVCLYVSYV